MVHHGEELDVREAEADADVGGQLVGELDVAEPPVPLEAGSGATSRDAPRRSTSALAHAVPSSGA